MKTIRLPHGHVVTIAEYVRSWKRLLTVPPDRQVANWTWYPVSAGSILADIRTGVHDRINRHLPWFGIGGNRVTLGGDHMRLRRHLNKLVSKRLLTCECRWCGSPLATYQPHENRFCHTSCRHSFYH